MARYTYGPMGLFSAGGNGLPDVIVENGTGGIFSATLNGPALPVYDFNDQPILSISSSASGQAQWRVDDQLVGWVRFGSLSVRVMSNDAGELLQNTAAAVAAANAAAATAQQAYQDLQEALAGVGPGGGGVGTVTSVGGAAPDANGNVVVSKTTVGLANVDNTSDANKPVSAAQATAIAAAKLRSNHSGTQAFLSTTTGKRDAWSADGATVPAGADSDTLVFYVSPSGSGAPTAQPPGPAIQLLVDL